MDTRKRAARKADPTITRSGDTNQAKEAREVTKSFNKLNQFNALLRLFLKL